MRAGSTRVAVVLMAAALLVAACSSGDDDGGAATDDATGATTTSAADDGAASPTTAASTGTDDGVDGAAGEATAVPAPGAFDIDAILDADPDCPSPVAGEPLVIGYAADMGDLGAFGDGPASQTAMHIADLVVDRRTSVVIDVSQLRKNERKQFAADFAEQLFQRKKQESAPTPLHLFVEESQVFAPQHVGKSEGLQRMLGAFEDIVRLGRNFGIGASLITQRPQAVNKEVLNLSECLFVFQTSGAHEREALKKWTQENDSDRERFIGDLPGLGEGHCFMWSPSWLRTFQKIRFSKRVTYDASATPKLGATRAVKAEKLAPVDVERLRSTAPIGRFARPFLPDVDVDDVAS